MNSSKRSAVYSHSLRRLIVTGALLPVSLVTAAKAADVLLPPNLNINSDAGAPIFVDGLREGFIAVNNEFILPNPFNGPDNGQGQGISLGLRMGQSTAVGPTAWQDNRTWVYTGEIFTGPNGILSFAANNDDSDWISVNGVVRLNDPTWNVANATTVTGLTPNSWVPFEYRVANGNGGAGPSAQGANWTNTMGVVFSYNDEGGSVDPLVYDQGRPAEPAGGGQTVFRFQNGFGLADDLVVQDSATITIDGSNTTISELSLRFTNPNPATLTINDAAATPHKVLSIAGLTQWATAASGGANVTLAGTSDLRPIGAQTDNGNIVTVTNNGPGKLILDTFNAGSNLISTTFAAGTGVVEVTSSSGTTPVPGAILGVNNAAGILRIGSANASPATFSNNIQAFASGTLQHSSAASDTLSGPITVNSGQNLNFNVTGGRLIITAGVSANQSGAGITKSGPNLLRTTAAVNARNLIMNEGRFEALGNVNFFTNSPVLNGGVLVLGNTSGTNTLPNPFIISGAGAVEGRAGSFGPTSNVIQLTGGGTLRLSGNSGLQGFFYGGDSAGARGSFGGPTNTANTYLSFTTYFGARGGLEASSLTSAGGVEVLSFDPAGGNTAMFGAYGQTRTDEIVARMMGKIFIPQAGTYTFSTTSDDGSMLYIDGVAVASNNADQGMTRRGGSIVLTAGLHDIDMGYFEGGGGNGFVVDWGSPGINGTPVLPNSVLYPNSSPELFANPINVTGNATLNTLAVAGRVTANFTVQSGNTLTTIGNSLAIDNLILPVSGGTYGFAPSNETIISHITDSGNPVTINVSGSGLLTIDNVGAAQLQNPASVISVNSGSLGVLLGGATNPTGNATVAFNGGGVVLSSKNGNQTFSIPAFTGSANLQARKLASGLAGTQETPIVITLQGNLNVPAGATINLGTADNYVEEISGTATGSGTVGVTGGTVTSNSNTAMSGLRVNFSGVGASARLNLATNGPKVGALHSHADATVTTVVGDGLGGAAVLEIEGTANGVYSGALNPAGISTFSVVKNGPGSQFLAGPSSATSYTVNSGTLKLATAALADPGVPLNLAGGALEFASPGLFLRIYDTNPDATVGGAPGAYTGILNTLSGVFQRYNALGVPSISASTAANGNGQISYNPGAGNEAPFAIHGQTDADTIEAIFTGEIRTSVAGNWTFDPRSDDGTMVYVDGILVSNNNFPQGIGHVPRPGTINLTEGLHSIVITYNEGGGGAGMYVNVSGPDSASIVLSNHLLFNPNFSAGNPVNISGNSAINPNSGTVALGNATHASGAVLTANGGGTVSFLQSSPSAGAELNYNINANTVISPGQIVGANTLNVSGAGSLLLDFNGPQLATGNVNVSNGAVTVATTAGGSNPLGGSIVNLSNGGNLNLTGLNPTADTTYSNQVNIGVGGGFVRAGRFGVGTTGAFTMTYAAPLNVTNGAPLGFGAVDGYNLVLANPVVSNGPLSSVSGNVQANAALTGASLAVTGGRLDTIGALNFSGGTTIGAGSTLRLNGNTYTGGAMNVSGTLEFNGSNAFPAATNVDGGLIRVVSGTANFGATTITGSVPVITPTSGVLTGKAYNSVNPVGGFGTDQGIANTLTATPVSTTPLGARDLTFGPGAGADGEFNTFFGTQLTDAFTAAFSGTFTASGTGLNPFSFGIGIQDDNASVWMDLNQNGILEQNGSAGSERIINLNCCGTAPADNTTNAVVNLVGGQKYGVVFIVEDTGGNSGLAVKWAEGNVAGPGGLANFVNPAAQPTFWSSDSKVGGAKLEVGAGSELRAGGFTNVGDAFLSGDGAKLALNGVSGTSATVDVIRNSINATTSTVEVGAGNTLTANHITVAPGTTLVKTGSGTLMAPGLSIGGGGAAFNVTAGLVVYTASAQASAAGGNTGAVNVSDTGTFQLQGSLSGAINVNSGGTLTGSGTLGALTAATNSIVSPGGTGIGTLNTGDALLLDDAILNVDLLSPASTDKLNVTGIVLLTETPGPVLNLALAPGFTAQINDIFPLILNDLDDAVVGHFSGLLEGANVNVGNNVFQVTYVANLDAGAVGNDVALIYTVPEPGALVMLLGGFGMLVGAQRIRRKGQS